MRFNWALLVDLLREEMIEATKIEGQNPAHTKDLNGYFRMTMRGTDTFHPFGHDRDLDGAFTRLPSYCNYRSIDSYWGYKGAMEELVSRTYDYFIAMETLIRDHFANPWNFPPRYSPPKSVEFGNLEKLAEKVLPGIISKVRTK